MRYEMSIKAAIKVYSFKNGNSEVTHDIQVAIVIII